MSHPLIARDPHLRRLVDEGYALEVRSGHLLVHDIPYVDSERTVHRDGVLVMPHPGESSTVPPDHTTWFIGRHPCTAGGAEIVQMKNMSGRKVLAADLEADHRFSAKPKSGRYPDFYEKVSTYAEIISGPARLLAEVTAKTYRPISCEEAESVFLYLDTASSRAGIQAAADRLRPQKLAIVGLGGTGAYVLDFVAKTPVAEIHLFDGDTAHQHTAFRFPGAMSLAQLEASPTKVDHLQAVYSQMRRKIIPHAELITPENVSALRDFDYVFLCVDKGSVRNWVVSELRGTATTIIDVGMGVQLDDETSAIHGICRTTTLSGDRHGHAERTIPLQDSEDDGVYRNNVQIVELNALNAALAVIRWKKLCGFYADEGGEHHMTYTLSTNRISNDEVANEG